MTGKHTISDLEAAVQNARDANRLATLTVIGTARGVVMIAREGHLTAVALESLSAAVEAQIETEQAVVLAGAALLAALAKDGVSDAPEAP